MKIIGYILTILGLGCLLTAVIFQQIICYTVFGALFVCAFFPHWTAFLFLGVIPFLIGIITIRRD